MTMKTFKVQQQNCLHKTKLSTIWNNFQFKVQIETINLIYFLQSFVILYCIILNKQNERNLIIRFMSIKTLIGSSIRIYLSFSFFSFLSIVLLLSRIKYSWFHFKFESFTRQPSISYVQKIFWKTNISYPLNDSNKKWYHLRLSNFQAYKMYQIY